MKRGFLVHTKTVLLLSTSMAGLGLMAGTLQQLVKKKTPVFLAVVWGQEHRQVNAAVKTESIGLTEGKKRDLMRKTGLKKKFLSVEEREEQILEKVSPKVRGKLKELVDEFKDVFPDTLPKGRPPKRGIVHEICTEEGAKPLVGHHTDLGQLSRMKWRNR